MKSELAVVADGLKALNASMYSDAEYGAGAGVYDVVVGGIIRLALGVCMVG